MKIHAWLICSGLVIAAAPCHAASVPEEQDAAVIQGLRDAGSDLSKPHLIDFFFYFPDRKSAEAAAAELRSLRYDVFDIGAANDQSVWLVQANRSLVPDLAMMNASTRELEALAARHGGDYDGWGTSVVEPEAD